METFHTLSRLSHIGLGFASLALFWLQIFSVKGSPRHIFFGRVFYIFGTLVALTAIFGVALVLGAAWADGVRPDDRPGQFSAYVLLGYLGAVTLVVLQRAVNAIRARRGPGLWQVAHMSIGVSALAASLALIAYASVVAPPNAILLYALSPIGILMCIEMISFAARPKRARTEWMFEHMTGMIGAGIAFHTAFFAFGASQFTEPLLAGSWFELAPWLLPAAIGIPAEILWKRKLRRNASTQVQS